MSIENLKTFGEHPSMRRLILSYPVFNSILHDRVVTHRQISENLFLSVDMHTCRSLLEV